MEITPLQDLQELLRTGTTAIKTLCIESLLEFKHYGSENTTHLGDRVYIVRNRILQRLNLS